MKMSKLLGKAAKAAAIGGTIGGIVYFGQKNINSEAALKERYRSYYQLLLQWINNKNSEKAMDEYFKEHGIKTIAIYGMGTLGELFYQDIKKTDIKVLYFIDNNTELVNMGMDDVPVVNVEQMDSMNIPDAVIITPVYDFDEIDMSLEEKGCNIMRISLEDIIFSN